MRVLILCLSAMLAAAPRAEAVDCQPDADLVIRALNAVRAEARACGAKTWTAAPPLRWHPTLAQAARRHATELAALDRLEHVSANGDTPRARLRHAGYAMRISGENLAGGAETVDDAMAQWVESPAHCENLMYPAFQDAGLACATGPGRLERYWVLTLAAPRSNPDRLP